MSERIYESVVYRFTEPEITDLGRSLARAAKILIDLRDAKSTANARYTADIKEAQEEVLELTDKVNLGSELRQVEVMVVMETPRPGMKRLIRIDTNTILRDEPMTKEEMQTSFGFNEGDEREAGA